MIGNVSGSITPASFAIERSEKGDVAVVLTGNWTLRGMARNAEPLIAQLLPYGRDSEVRWDLTQIVLLDSAGAYFLWRASKGKPPLHFKARPEHLALFRRWAARDVPDNPGVMAHSVSLWSILSYGLRTAVSHGYDFMALVGQFVLDLVYLVQHPKQIPIREISATIYRTGVRALGITAIVGLLIGIVVSYLSALELKAFGAQSFIVNILGLSIVRELGPMLAAILVAGRSGSSMTARLGVMRITQELDAMNSMGISQSQRLVLPKIIALIIALPLLVIWTDAAALLGGMFSANLEVGINFRQFIELLPGVVPVVNLWIGLSKGAVFGLVVASIACHFGLRIKPDTES
ncbi:MAG TPA: ABC transporter permease, partial [Gammaproteobacteria bacterium]|nr:ABC transporter permease [Gammaproteobacteria bacterium]